MKRWIVCAVAAGVLVSLHGYPAFGAQLPNGGNNDRHVRYLDDRIEEVASIAYAQSAAFRALVAVLESSDVVVYVDRGWCMRGAVRSCLHIMTSGGGVRYLHVTLDPYRALTLVVAQLAHELHHATEVANRPEVVDDRTLNALYGEIGFECHDRIGVKCWETEAAKDSERRVQQQVAATLSIAANKP
jgi:hypothetical protein